MKKRSKNTVSIDSLYGRNNQKITISNSRSASGKRDVLIASLQKVAKKKRNYLYTLTISCRY